jgi:FMN phosphatase YigB (HAD superfamily)
MHHPLDPPPKMIDTVYVLDRTILNEAGAVTDAHFMGVLTSRTNVERRINAARHFGGVEHGLYRVIELVPDDRQLTHIYQVKVVAGKQSWLRLAKNKSEGSDDYRMTIEELKLFVPKGTFETWEMVAELKARRRRDKALFLSMMATFIMVLLVRWLMSL